MTVLRQVSPQLLQAALAADQPPALAGGRVVRVAGNDAFRQRRRIDRGFADAAGGVMSALTRPRG